jgi:hypothetical protein
MTRSYPCNPAALVSGSHPEAALVLVPASRALADRRRPHRSAGQEAGVPENLRTTPNCCANALGGLCARPRVIET